MKNIDISARAVDEICATVRFLAGTALAAFILYGLYLLVTFPGHINQ